MAIDHGFAAAVSGHPCGAAGRFALAVLENDFLVVAGSGLLHPDYGFGITNVEAFTNEFIGPDFFPDTYLEAGLAVVVTTSFPGPKPPKADPIYRLEAVSISRDFLAPAVISRQIIAYP